jgi:hypothetical protein
MPRPIPPPPPQPTVEETAAGVRLVYALVALALAVFGALTLTYRVDSPIVHYGRQFAISWNLWKLDRLDEGAARAHPGGRIAWLVGSSILRESFDVAAINAALEERGSEWRVQKFGLNSGAAGLSWGVARRLPIREGDRLIHGVQIENFQRDWLSFAQLPHWMLGAALTLDELWDVEELTVQEKLEQTVAIPRSFWTFHDEYQAGLTAWLLAPWYMKVPEVRERNYHVRYHPRLETHERLGRMRAAGERSRFYLVAGDLDYRPTQFNMQGLNRMRELAEARGAEFVLIDSPSRQEYPATMVDAAAWAEWRGWVEAQPETIYLPQLPEDYYYDFKHPNFRGRPIWTAYLADWLDDPVVGEPAQQRWPLE